MFTLFNLPPLASVCLLLSLFVLTIYFLFQKKKSNPISQLDLKKSYPGCQYEIIKKKYEDIINSFLEKRDCDNLIQFYGIYELPCYVALMLKELNKVRPELSIPELIKMDIQAAGHIDYVSQFANRLTESELEIDERKIL